MVGKLYQSVLEVLIEYKLQIPSLALNRPVAAKLLRQVFASVTDGRTQFGSLSLPLPRWAQQKGYIVTAKLPIC